MPNAGDCPIPEEPTAKEFSRPSRRTENMRTARMCILSRSRTVPITHPDDVNRSKEESQFGVLILALAKTFLSPDQYQWACLAKMMRNYLYQDRGILQDSPFLVK